MYKIYCDDLILYHPLLNDYKILKGECTKEVNKAGTLTFTLPEANPHYGLAKLMKSIITLYEDEKLIFRGRPYAPNRNLYKDNEIICEGELAFLNDTYQDPFDYNGDVITFFTNIINKHNSQVSADKQFIVGNVNVVNDTDEGNIIRSSIEYLNTWELIGEKLIESSLGGYLWVRHEQDGIYLDYLSDLNFLGGQKVEQSINLIEAEENKSVEELATVIIPLGAKVKDENDKETDEFITISDVNGGNIYLQNDDAVSLYGRITKVVKHKDIDDKNALKAAGEVDLANAIGVTTSIELTAADLSKAGYTVDPFSFGTYVPVRIKNLDIDDNMLINKITKDLLCPENDTITLGRVQKGLSKQHTQITEKLESIESDFGKGIRTSQRDISQVRLETESAISQSAASIMQSVSEQVYEKGETDELISALSTLITQNANSVTFEFAQFTTALQNLTNSTDAEFANILKYIHFVDGNIILGETGSEITLTLENDILYFKQNEVKVMKITNNKLEITDGKFKNSLQVGNFGFTPRSNGNLSFGKIAGD